MNSFLTVIDKYQFSLTRIFLGIYLFFFFLFLIPHSDSYFSNIGMINDFSSHPTYGYFPSILYIYNSPRICKTALLLSSLFSFLLAIGFFRRASAFIVWYLFCCLWNQNEMFWSPAMPFICWLLLLFSFVQSGEKLSFRPKEDWHMAKEYKQLAFFTLALGYSVSGLFKLVSPSWIEGHAIKDSINWIWSRDYFYTKFYSGLPDYLMNFVTWGSLLAELLFLPLSIFKFARPITWLALTLMQLNILLLLDIMDLTLGVLIFHFFVFDANWLRAE